MAGMQQQRRRWLPMVPPFLLLPTLLPSFLWPQWQQSPRRWQSQLQCL
jgi:hypothetical protein